MLLRMLKSHEQKLVPVKNVIVEVANFDIQKIKNPDIEGKEYQEGEQKGFFNTREYILHRDNHCCQNPNCKNKAKNPILQIHHIRYQSMGGSDRPNNLITLCTKCHTSKNHKKGGFLYDWCMNGKKVRQFKDSTFMSMVRWRIVEGLDCEYTYGYITKSNRIKHGIEKSHRNDAFVISGGSNQTRSQNYTVEQSRLSNRVLRKLKNPTPKSKGEFLDCRWRCSIQPNDLVEFEGKKYYAVGGRKGKPSKKTGLYNPSVELHNTPKNFSKSVSKVKVIERKKSLTWKLK